MKSMRHAVPPSKTINYAANPGANGVAVLYDDLQPQTASLRHEWSTANHFVEVAIFVDQPVTIRHEWAAPNSTNLRAVNDDGAAVAVPPGAYFDKRFRLRAGRNRITILTGTACQTWEVGVQTDEAACVIASDLAALLPQ